MEKDYLILKRASAPPSGEWNDDDYDVLADGVVVGRTMKANAAPVGAPWMWTLLFDFQRGPHADARLRADARGCDGGFREELAAEVTNISYGLSKRRLTAFDRPPRAGPISYATSWPATNVFMPAASTSWIWTKTSGPPSSGKMKPNPRSGLKDLTRPVRHGPSLNVP